MTRISIRGYEPAPALVALAKSEWPDKSDAWRTVWIQRLGWYIQRNGDMRGAPEFPEDE